MAEEFRLWLCFCWIGFVAGLGYDGLRLLRRLCTHTLLWITLEDILFWCMVGFATYRIFFLYYSGVLRAYGGAGELVGYVLYARGLRPRYFGWLEKRIFGLKKRLFERKKFSKSIDE